MDRSTERLCVRPAQGEFTVWKITMSSILSFEERREQAAREADTFSAELEQLGAPAE